MLLNSFIFSNFIYCPHVWHFSSTALSQKIEKIQERASRLLYNDSYSSYNSVLLKAEQPFAEISNRSFKEFKILKSRLHAPYFKKDSHSARRKNGLVANRAKTTTFGEKSLRVLGSKIWNSLPEDVKD